MIDEPTQLEDGAAAPQQLPRKQYRPRKPQAVREALQAAPLTTLIDRRNPLNSLPTPERAAAAWLARTARPAARKALPRNWAAIVSTICSRPWTRPQLSAALGLSPKTLIKLVEEYEPLSTLIQQCDANFIGRLVNHVAERALAGDTSCSLWLLARLDPTRFGDKPTAPPPISLTLNLPAAVPLDQLAKIFGQQLPAPIDVTATEVPAPALPNPVSRS